VVHIKDCFQKALGLIPAATSGITEIKIKISVFTMTTSHLPEYRNKDGHILNILPVILWCPKQLQSYSLI
jgi:hypothetical protein